MLFVKYISDKYAGVPYAPITIPEGANFKDMVALKGKTDIGDQINKKIIGPLATANKLSDMPDFNDATKLGSGKEIVDRLTNLIAIFENKALDFSKNRADGDDILGDAYEYLMRHFATESGKSKGQFYTPAEVSRIMAQIIGIHDAQTTNDTTVYDPTCGSGSLLLKVGDEASAKVSLYGQEKDAATSGLARMNMILHNNPTALIRQGNTLANPLFTTDDGQLKTFDYVVANPPFSDKRWSNGVDPLNDPHARFKHFGVPPGKQGDYAYLLHIVRSLKSTGKGACILPHGVLFRGNAEAEIRRNLIRKGYIKGIIGLPPNLFYGTGIPACIIVVDKENAHNRKAIFMIDASAGYMKDGNKNRFRDMDIHQIVDVFNKRLEIPKYSRMVGFEEIEKNKFNLNIPRYIDSKQSEDIQDIEGHLRGGIPAGDIDALDRYWSVCPQLRQTLFSHKRPSYLGLAVAKEAIKPTIYSHEEFVTFMQSMEMLFADWRLRSATKLKGLCAGFHPKSLIKELAGDLLAHYTAKQLIDKYDVYQHLMDYWAGTMQDDCYLIAADSWKAETYRVVVKNKKGSEIDKGWACDLIPKNLIVNRYFAADQEAIRELEAELQSLSAKLTELEEEHGGEDGALNAVSNRSDAMIAWQEALVTVWQSSDAINFGEYTKAIASQESARNRFLELEADPRIQALMNGKGKMTESIINARLQRVNDADELILLESYKATTITFKEAKVTAEELFQTATTFINERLQTEPDNEDLSELRVLKAYIDRTERMSDLAKALKKAQDKLDALAYAKYPTLTEVQIKTLVVDDKWLGAVDAAIHGEMDRISQTLTRRVKELAERYETPLPQQVRRVSDLERSVNAHLERMGFSWN
jgi:type I restriction enzyme M protein